MSTRRHHALSSAPQPAGSAVNIIHTLSEGEYEIDFISIMPSIAESPGTMWVITTFVFEPSSLTVVQDLGAGYATNELPFTIKGPIPIKGPGYLWFRGISQSAYDTDTIDVQFSFRRLIS